MSTAEEIKGVEGKEKIFKTKKDKTINPGVQKKKIWKSLKQLIAAEKSLAWQENAVHYSSINAPPSFKPTKKYSDISGLVAPYTDPSSKLQFSSADEYQTILNFPSDIISGYLALRRAQIPI